MAITVATLTSGADLAPAGVTSNTASITPTADRSTYLAVLSERTLGALAAPTTPTSNGLTWTQVATVTFNLVAAALSRLTVFRGSGSSPTAGVIPITHAATPTGVVWWVVDVDKGPITSSAVVQSATGRADLGTTASVTLAAFARPVNGALAFTAVAAGPTVTAGTGWTDLGTQSTRLQAQWRADPDTTPDSTFTAANWAMIAAELAADFTLAGNPAAGDAGNAFKANLQSFGGGSAPDLALNQAVVVKTSGAAVAGAGSVSAGVVVVKTSGAAVAGAGSISAGATGKKFSGAAVTGAGTISAGAAAHRGSGAAIVGTGSVSAGVAVRRTSGAALVSVGTIRAGAKLVRSGVSWCAGARRRPGT